MKKSYNDIMEQLGRVLSLANELGGKYTQNAKHRVNTQRFAQIARNALVARGIGFFCKDTDVKYELKSVTERRATRNALPIQLALPL